MKDVEIDARRTLVFRTGNQMLYLKQVPLAGQATKKGEYRHNRVRISTICPVHAMDRMKQK